MKQPLLSIVVPTKNRYVYLYKLIDLVKSFNFSDFEFHIQDNTADNSEFLQYLNHNNYNFISYHHYAESISMTENCDLAIANSKGEYICFIGDDDGFCQQVMNAVKFMKENKVDVLLSSTTFYNWPDYYDPSMFKLYSSIQFVKGSGKLKKIDSLYELNKCVNNGFDGLYKMPHAYQSLISRAIMEKIYSIYGTYFPGPSPDMANAVALSQIEPNTYYFDGPLVISGQSRSVGGGERLLKSNELKRLEDVPIMPRNIYEYWDTKLPTYWCGDTIWPQSGIMSLRKPEYIAKVNYELIMARFIFYHRSYYSECKTLIDNKVKFLWSLFKFFIRKIFVFADHRLSYLCSNGRKLSGTHIVRNMPDMGAAVDYLSQYSFKK